MHKTVQVCLSAWILCRVTVDEWKHPTLDPVHTTPCCIVGLCSDGLGGRNFHVPVHSLFALVIYYLVYQIETYFKDFARKTYLL